MSVEQRHKDGSVTITLDDAAPSQTRQSRGHNDDAAITRQAEIVVEIRRLQSELPAAKEAAWTDPGRNASKAIAIERRLVQLAHEYKAAGAARSADSRRDEYRSSGQYWSGERIEPGRRR